MSETDESLQPEDIVLELVVAGQGDHASPGHTKGEKDLNAGVRPDLEKVSKPWNNFIW